MLPTLMRYLPVLLLVSGTKVFAGDPIVVRGAAVSLRDDIEVACEDVGLLREVHVRPGDEVVAGQLLARLDTEEAQLLLRRVEAELSIAATAAKNDLAVQLANKNHQVAAAELRRAEETNEKYPGTVSATELDRLRLTVDRTQLEIKQAEQELLQKRQHVELLEADRDLARHKLSRREIQAPASGRVTRVDADAGEQLQPGQSLCRIVNLRQVWVQGFVAGEFGRTLDGCRAVVTVVRRDVPIELAGVVRFLDPDVNPVNGMARLWVLVDNVDEQLTPGESVELRVLPDDRE
ncbi:MAG: efflux RND transporter periplasmic adaptor subunit [Planctomycetaceae bacterium]|nr:efflux RND transporter periplasmic adaptor subunit [Planctomycetaceae bacterium]